MSDLRTRIAAVLADADGMSWNEWSQPAQDGYLLRADAVIRELGLREESRGPVTAYRGGQYRDNQTLRRYVTQWTTDGGDPDA
jgi:hypothetical protein